MLTIKTTITVLPDGTIQVPPIPNLPPGVYRVVVMVDQMPAVQPQPTPEAESPLKLTTLDTPNWPIDARFRQADMDPDE